MKCLKCGYLNDHDAEFCENCGEALQLACPACGAPLKPGARFCKKCGAQISAAHVPKGEQGDTDRTRIQAPTDSEKPKETALRVKGERKPVTILFTDIVESTALAEKIDPEEWKEVVSGAHRRVIEVVHQYEGTIAQLLGDGVLAFFGAPDTHEDDPVRAVRASLDIQEEISRYAFGLKGYIDNFRMRIGLNTGMVVVGEVGTELHMEYLAIGDAVNLAARLQSAAQPGKILISENTARLVKAAFHLLDMGEVTVKGKSEPVRAFEVLESKEAHLSTRGFEELQSPMVGRSVELSEIVGVLEQLCKGHGQIVSVLGEAGIGKSRLVEEAQCSTVDLEYKATPNVPCKLNWIEGRSLSYGTTLSFWTISQLIKNDLGLSDGDPEPKIRFVLGKRVSKLFGEHSDEAEPYLARLLGVKLEGRLADQLSLLDSETLKRQTLLSITQYFEKLALYQPTVAVFEDLHWADPSSLEALEMMLSVTDRAPLMLLLLTRLERERQAWGIKLKAETEYAHRYSEILLKPLSDHQQNQLMDNLLKIADLPEQLRKLILEHAEGNPFYLEEIVRSLIEQNAIERAGDHWRATQEISKVTIPDTLQGVLLARLDRLQEDVRRTLQAASVIGRSFLYSILEEVNEAEHQLDKHLAQLQRVDLVREKTRIPELEYMFKHTLTQEAAYSSLLFARRCEFHRKVGEALEKLFPERLEEFYGMLAYHFEAAGEEQKAVDYLIRAGDRARLMYELTEAIGYYNRATPLLSKIGDIERLAQVWFKLGLVYSTCFQFEEAHHANEQAFALQKRLAPIKNSPLGMKPAVLRIAKAGSLVTLDPGLVNWENDFRITVNLFAGLVQVDTELNVVPDAARSWHVLDGGRRYQFFLRDDLYWSDGTPLTAHDFVYAWKRNLRPDFDNRNAQYLFNVTGAKDYYDGLNPNPESVGVHALDEHVLEVCLEEPIAYFLYMLSLPVAFPLPGKAVERFGDDWWKPEHIICNGPYRLVKFDALHGSTLERNPYYHGEYQGNIQHIELTFIQEATERVANYQGNSSDLIFLEAYETLENLPPHEIRLFQQPSTTFMVINPKLTPLGDVRIRKALGLAIDREALFRTFGIKSADGGLIPPGMPGHSPHSGLSFDLETSQRLLAEAGYPGGKGLPSISGICNNKLEKYGTEITRQWRDHLGIDVHIEPKTQTELVALSKKRAVFNLFITGWLADYPDPDNILCQQDAFLFIAYFWGWKDEAYDRLVIDAGRTADQKKRMEMYRQADRILVQDQVVTIPISYSSQIMTLVKPWVKNLKITPTGKILSKDIIIEDH